jgi:hypothetical protein
MLILMIYQLRCLKFIEINSRLWNVKDVLYNCRNNYYIYINFYKLILDKSFISKGLLDPLIVFLSIMLFIYWITFLTSSKLQIAICFKILPRPINCLSLGSLNHVLTYIPLFLKNLKLDGVLSTIITFDKSRPSLLKSLYWFSPIKLICCLNSLCDIQSLFSRSSIIKFAYSSVPDVKITIS